MTSFLHYLIFENLPAKSLDMDYTFHRKTFRPTCRLEWCEHSTTTKLRSSWRFFEEASVDSCLKKFLKLTPKISVPVDQKKRSHLHYSVNLLPLQKTSNNKCCNKYFSNIIFKKVDENYLFSVCRLVPKKRKVTSYRKNYKLRVSFKMG